MKKLSISFLSLMFMSASFWTPSSFAGCKNAGHTCCQSSCQHSCSKGDSMGMDTHGNYFLDFEKELELTEAQVSKLNQLRNETQKQLENLMAKKHAAWEDLTKISHENNVKKKTIDKASDKFGSIYGDIVALQTQSILDAKKILTKEQHKKMWDAHHKNMDQKSETGTEVSCH
ncbi:MAG: hypothetical protein KDD48_07025 [Bdellovibrionales bacterium]|nr:hypothetical protein [Bdellovibrionales bacterium]